MSWKWRWVYEGPGPRIVSGLVLISLFYLGVELGVEVGLRGTGSLEFPRHVFPHNATNASETFVITVRNQFLLFA